VWKRFESIGLAPASTVAVVSSSGWATISTSGGRIRCDRGWVSRIVVGLDVRICERLVQAGDDGLKSQLWICTGKSVGQDISSGNLNGLLEKVMFEDDETSVQRRSVGKDVLPILQNLARGDSSCVDVVISSVESRSGADTGPHDGSQPHRQGNGTNPVIYVTIGRPHRVGRDAQDVLNNLLGPPKLRNDLFGGQGSKGSGVAPRVHGNVMLGHVLALEEGGEGNGTRTNDKERGLEGVLVEEVQEIGGVERGTVIVCKTPGVLCGARDDVSVTNASTARPPTTTGVLDGVWVGRASSSYRGIKGWDLDAGRLDLGNPLLDLWGVGGGNGVELGVFGRRNG
jgi:hypothetical protein